MMTSSYEVLPSECNSDESLKSEIIDLFLMDMKYESTRGFLNFQFSRTRNRGRKLEIVKQEVMEMENEIQELRSMIRRTEVEIEAVEGEKILKVEELDAMLKLVDTEKEVEVKKKEPLLFRKYSNVKTASQCLNLVKMVRHKQRALQHLELLLYRKYANFQNEVAAKSVKMKAQPLLRINPGKLKDFKPFSIARDNPDGQVYLEIEDSPQGLADDSDHPAHLAPFFVIETDV